MRSLPSCEVLVISGDLDNQALIEMSRAYAAAKEIQMIELERVHHFTRWTPLQRASQHS